MYQYILFDLDGTLSDPKEGITKSVNHALEAFGMAEEDLSKLEPFIGPPLQRSFQEFYEMSEEVAVAAIRIYRERFSEVGWRENEIYPGIKEMLQLLYKQGRYLAIASSKPQEFVERILKYFEIEKYFQVIVGADMNGPRVEKEQVLEEALGQLRKLGSRQGELPVLNEQNTVMIGDRRFDVQGAKAYGLASIGVRYGYAPKGELEDSAPDYIVDTVEELRELLSDKKTGERVTASKKKVASKRNTLSKEAKGHNGTSKVLGMGGSEAYLPLERKLWNLVVPMVLYYLSASVFMLVTMELLKSYMLNHNTDTLEWWLIYGEQVSVTVNGLGMLVGVLFVRKIFLTERIQEEKTDLQQMVPVLLIGICASLGLNILFEALGITKSSASYTETATIQHSVPLWLGILLYGVVSAFAEEVIFRGIIYQRLKKYFSVVPAMICSSVLFGVYHGNIVQAVYGSIMGMLIVVVYEWCRTFWAPVLLHSAANLAIFLIARNERVSEMLANPVFGVIFVALAGMCVYYMYRIQGMTAKEE